MKAWNKMRAVLLAGTLLLCSLVLSSCGENSTQEDPENPEVTILTYAILDQSSVNKGAIDRFNRDHDDVKIVTKNYARLSENGKQGADLLKVELATGKVPDIIDLGSDGQLCELSYMALAKKGYLEDLWPFIENDPEVRLKEEFLRPAEVDGGLYTVYNAVRIQTLLGAESVVGDRTSWSVEEMLDVYAAMPHPDLLMDDVLLENVRTVPSMKNYLLSTMMSGFINLFIDWDAGTCSFDGQQFRGLLEFINMIPDTPEEYRWRLEDIPEDEEISNGELHDRMAYRMYKGEVMLGMTDFYTGFLEPRYARVHFGGQPVPVGYPLGSGVVGSYYEPVGAKLCISSTCKDKEAAWEFVRQMFIYNFRPKDAEANIQVNGFPVQRTLYGLKRKRLWYAGRGNAGFSPYEYIGWQKIPFERETAEGADRLDDFFASITFCSVFLEPAVLEMIEEETAAYFAGAIPLDQAVERIQSRASLYVNEHM